MDGRHRLPEAGWRRRALATIFTSGLALAICMEALPAVGRPAAATPLSDSAVVAGPPVADPPPWYRQTLATFIPARRLPPATAGLPPILLASLDAKGRPTATSTGTLLDASAMPALVLAAYHRAAAVAQANDPTCHLPWQLLAGIGRVESNNGQHFGAAGHITVDGTISPPILGPPLDGEGGNAAIPNREPALDGNGPWARAVGPMQFLPSTWDVIGADGNGDGRSDPNNIYDAALAAARYLCAAGGDLSKPGRLGAAVYSYNHSDVYVREVLGLVAAYEHVPVSDLIAPATPVRHRTAHHHARPAQTATPTPTPTKAASSAPPTPKPSASATPTATASASPAPTATPTPSPSA